uniref:PUM-HD domain-containing protein n=1 Tax=Strongyloides papillosus TaxID=174720 RepID=A0A0N5BZ73_STREA
MVKAVKKPISRNTTPRTPANGVKSKLNDSIGSNSSNGSPGSQAPLTKKRKHVEEEGTPASVKRIRFLDARNEVKFFKKGSLLPPLKPSPCIPGRSILKGSAPSTPLTSGGKVKSPKIVKKVVKKVVKREETSSEESGSDDDEKVVEEKKVKINKKNDKKVVVKEEAKVVETKEKCNDDSEIPSNDKGKENKSTVVESMNSDAEPKEVESNKKSKKKNKKKADKEVATNEDTTAKVEEKPVNGDIEVADEDTDKLDNNEENDFKNSTIGDAEVSIEKLDISKRDSSEYHMFTKEDKEKMKTMTPEEKTKFINARLYETCKGKKRSEVKTFLRNLRVKKKPHVNIVYEVKKLWEELRMKKTSQKRKIELGLEIIAKMKGSMLKLVNGRDTSKVFQCLICLDDTRITQPILDELGPHLLAMSRSKYGSFFVSTLFMKTKEEERDILFGAFRGHVVKLYDVIFSAKVIDILYNQVANDKQKFDILCEFYGKEFVIFRQQDGFNSVEEMFAKYPEKKTVVLKNLLTTIKNCVGKQTATFDFTHKLIINYLDHCSKDQAKEVMDLYRDKILDLSGKKDGIKIALRILFNSSAKERKSIIKLMTSLVSSIAMDHNGYKLILGIFDQVDDTVLVNKTITHELITHLPDIVKSHNGNVVLQYIVQPRDVKVVDSQVIDLLSQGDGNEHSKKERSLRAQQIYDEIKESLLEYVTHFGRDIFKNKFTANLLYAIFENNKDSYLVDRQVPQATRETVYKKIADVIEEFFKEDEENPKNYKFLERNHNANHTINELLKSDEKSDVKLSSYLAKIDKGCFPMLLKTRVGNLVVSNMYKYGDKDVKEFVKTVAPSVIS